ncbi:hypothetical protein PR202_gb07902 [Eleusine coracana subsp. coracana]|uniref:Uncharacterized protein n=1 Tax=Eleusine coracana subsp. coracana TaxID=191504 RepID=A0AAV5EDS4_ELECO|nr:hypothetical protein QOZ80_2BG0178690 [Eleusine coracana subsp. coracana]GJN20513.1 hypothetical protein PR202_gb07902 [Eleusine coracana subsp. coracana]
MERWAPAPARERPRRRPGQPSFSSTLLDAICDAMDDQPAGATTTADTAAATRKQRSEAAALHHCYYYYKPSLAASHRVAAPEAGAADDCYGGRGYFSSSEVEHSLRRLRPIRTSAAAPHQPDKQQAQQQPATTTTEKARRARKPANGPARRPASPGARLAGLLNAIFTGKRHSARQHPAPPEDEPSTARPSKTTTTPPPHSARPSRSRRGRTVRFLNIDGEVAVAAAVSGRRQVPVVEVEEVLFRPADTDVGEESSDGSSDLFEIDNLAAGAPAGGGGGRHRRVCGDELPVYGTTGVGLRRGDIGRRRPFGYGSLARSYSRVV